MRGQDDTLRDKLEQARFQPSRHGWMLTPAQAEAYRAAGGGAAGRRAVLALLDGGSTELELHKEAWIGVYLRLYCDMLDAEHRERADAEATAAIDAFVATGTRRGYDPKRETRVPQPPTHAENEAWHEDLKRRLDALGFDPNRED